MFGYVLMTVAGLFMIGFLVVVHEAGHFLAARFFGVGTPVFSIGMGPRLFGFTWWETDFRISLLPVGGYVRMSGADPFGEQDDSEEVPPEQDFMRRPVWQRFIIMFAGPGVNLALPFFVFTVLMMLGRPDVGPEIGRVFEGSAAERAGLQPHDLIRAVDGRPVEIWHDVVQALAAHEGAATLNIERDGQAMEVALPAEALKRDAFGEFDLFALGAVPYDLAPRVAVARPDSAAARAGIQLGDWITEVDGEKVRTWSALLEALGSGEHDLTAMRIVDQQAVPVKLHIALAPEDVPGSGVYANAWGMLPSTLFVTGVDDPSSAAGRAGLRGGDRFVSVDGAPVYTFDHLRSLVAWSSPDGGDPRPVKVEVEREGQKIAVDLTPTWTLVKGEPRMRPVMGVSSYGDPLMYVPEARKFYSLFEAIPRAADETYRVMHDTVSMLGNLLTMRADPKDSVGGPIAIFRVAGIVAEQGFFHYATLIGMISVSLGFINLLPVPVFDGGQILFYLVEGVRGRPLSIEVRERLLMVGVVGMMVLMFLVSVMDVRRWMGS